MAAFSHNNICQIYDVGSNYIAMGLIDSVQLSVPVRPWRTALTAKMALTYTARPICPIMKPPGKQSEIYSRSYV